MTAEIHFPSRYLDKDILFEVYNYYCRDLDIDEDELEELSYSDPQEYINWIEQELLELHDCEINNSVIRLQCYDCADEETIADIEDMLYNKEVPYDSIDGGERYLYSYRPQQNNKVFRSLTHMDVDGPIYSLETLIHTLDSLDISDPKVLKTTLLKNIQRGRIEMPVPLRNLVPDNNFNNFQSIGLLQINNVSL